MRATVRATAAACTLVFAAIIVRTVNDGSAAPTIASPPAAVITQAPRACGTVLTTSVHGTLLDEGTHTLVRSIHDAACRHDPDDLARLMAPTFGGRTPAEAITDLLEWSPKGVTFDSLAAVLETAAHPGQGGLTYCTPHGAFASFARGTITHPGGWTDFQMIPQGDPPCV